MDLWIRSQHRKTLTKPCDLQMVHVNNGTEYAIISFTEMAGDIDLGIYKTEKRALEVLDEIDKYKNKLEKAHFLGMEESEFVSSTFQMPKEWLEMIDIVKIKQAVKGGIIEFYVINGHIFCENLVTEEVVEVGNENKDNWFTN